MRERSERLLVYRDEAQLVDAGGSFVCDALAEGGAAVALASEKHLRALEDWVSLCGSDISAAAIAGRYRGLEIEALLRSLDPEESVQRAICAQLEAALDGLAADAAPVHVFGEATRVVRAPAGEAQPGLGFAAIAQRLCERRPGLSLLCARQEDDPGDEACLLRGEAGGGLLRAPPFPVARKSAGGALASSAVLPPAPAACRAARRLVRAACASMADSEAVNAAELVVSELAGNAVRHARSTFRAEISFSNGSMRLAVTDAGALPEDWTGFPIAREHGLGLVAAIAEEWAVEPLAHGKMVWATLARTGESG